MQCFNLGLIISIKLGSRRRARPQLPHRRHYAMPRRADVHSPPSHRTASPREEDRRQPRGQTSNISNEKEISRIEFWMVI